MNLLCRLIRREREYAHISERAASQRNGRRRPAMITGLSDGALDSFLASFISDERKAGQPTVLIIEKNEKQARNTCEALMSFGLNAMLYQPREPVLYNIVASHEAEHDRISVLSSLISEKNVPDAVVAVPDAIIQYTIPMHLLSEYTKTLSVGDEISIENLCETLVGAGYVRCDPVEGVGQFSVRGGIVDIFVPGDTQPVRLEFFGDEIDQIARFDILTQRKTENTEAFNLTCAREILISPEKRKKLAAIIKAHAEKVSAEVRASLMREHEALVSGTEITFADKYISYIYPEGACLFDYLDENCAVLMMDSQAVAERMQSTEAHFTETCADLIESGAIIPKYCDITCPQDALWEFSGEHGVWILNTFMTQYRDGVESVFTFDTRSHPSVNGDFKLLTEDIETFIKAKYTIVLMTENEPEATNLSKMLEENGINTKLNLGGIEQLPPPGIPMIICACVSGFELPTSRCVCIQLYNEERSGVKSVYRRRDRKRKKNAFEKIMSYADLKIGDAVVHAAHGIGIYMGLENIRNYDGVCRDHIKIAYEGTDILYVPCDQIDMVSKYIGAHADDGELKLSRLGGAEWEKRKSRVKGEVKEMAKELIALYAERQRRPGFAFSADDGMQREFESTFEYEETNGQLEAARDIKEDMEKPVPMDRLLCGDVGFGKTEVALRAAFKAVENGKQVAILVPTTILALQHYKTIISRMRAFPIKVALLSRFKTGKEQDAAVRSLKRGDTDIVVGTHRLLSSDIGFKDLGLVIIDEEQRFGVAHKEKLKKISGNVDVLTLTATPIPRTLNMAMSSIRDMSVLDEAPGDRIPVQTFVMEHDDVVINEAIRRELKRGGQVFYLYNNIEGLYNKAAQLKKKFADANIEVAHGQMDKDDLSDIWQALVAGEIDILVCTTIIETGVDVPNANTLIIENADRMGLSQLHQLRGRVGRSARRAYAYFTYRQGRVLSEISEKRLRAIRDFTEFGAGFKIALRDLEIRGAGDILGARQHGHMESVGYDMYIKLLNEAVLEEKGVKKEEKRECTVNISRDAFIPEDYIPSSSQRIDMYKKIASVTTEEDADDIADELLDRYGDLPSSVETLISVTTVRALGIKCGMSQITETPTGATMYLYNPDFGVISEFAGLNPGVVTFVPASPSYLRCRKYKKEPIFTFILELLKKYIQISGKKL